MDPKALRILKVAMVVMGVLIVGGVGLLGVLLSQRLGGAAGSVAGVVLDEPAGTRITGTSAAPDRLLVQLSGGGPDRVVVVDTRSGKVLGRVGLAR